MKNLNKMFVMAMMGVLFIAGPSARVSAAEISVSDTMEADTDSSSGGTVLRKDNIITKYRLHNGRLQYRRWNTTYGVWVDPYWIDAN